MWNVPPDVLASGSDQRALHYVAGAAADPEEFLGKVERLFQARDQTHHDDVVLKDGRTIEGYSSPMFGPDGRYYGRTWFFRDISERVRLSAELRQAQKMDAIGRLAGGIAHDFNNLLTPILAYGELLLRCVGHDPRPLQYAEQIVKTAERAAALPRQLLAFSRKQVLELMTLDLNAVVADMGKMLGRTLGEDVRLTVVPSVDLWPVKADLGQIEQIILNLAVNARDAMPGGGDLTIETASVLVDAEYAGLHPGAVAGPFVMLAVSDTGCGMSKETLEHIFEPFFTTKEQGKGTGLGLATVYGIVTQYGGFIRVYSEPGHGTTLRIYLPRDEDGTAVAGVAAAGAAAGGSETVLVVEDDEAVRAAVCDILSDLGYRVLEADGGGTALVILGSHRGPIDLLLTDAIMPEMNGREVAEGALAALPSIRVILMSGYTENATVRQGVLGADVPFLQKPFTPDALARKVREVLDGPR